VTVESNGPSLINIYIYDCGIASVVKKKNHKYTNIYINIAINIGSTTYCEDGDNASLNSLLPILDKVLRLAL